MKGIIKGLIKSNIELIKRIIKGLIKEVSEGVNQGGVNQEVFSTGSNTGKTNLLITVTMVMFE